MSSNGSVAQLASVSLEPQARDGDKKNRRRVRDGKDISVVACEVTRKLSVGRRPTGTLNTNSLSPADRSCGEVQPDPLVCDVDPRDLAAVRLELGVCVRVCSAK